MEVLDEEDSECGIHARDDDGTTGSQGVDHPEQMEISLRASRAPEDVGWSG